MGSIQHFPCSLHEPLYDGLAFGFLDVEFGRWASYIWTWGIIHLFALKHMQVAFLEAFRRFFYVWDWRGKAAYLLTSVFASYAGWQAGFGRSKPLQKLLAQAGPQRNGICWGHLLLLVLLYHPPCYLLECLLILFLCLVLIANLFLKRRRRELKVIMRV